MAFIFTVAILWEAVRLIQQYSELLFPSVRSILKALWIERLEILGKTLFSLRIILLGLMIAILLAMIGTFISMSGKFFAEIVTNCIKAIIFVIVFSAVWPLINHFYSGFRSIPINQLEVGRNLGLTGWELGLKVMLPASFPHILSGLRTGWARAWQASVAAELVFGAAGGHGGLGWYLYKKRFMMETPGVFAGMVIIILIGIAMEYLIFASVENRTIKKWKTIIT
jgi:NitT/TauT family transport system permease protein